MMAWEKYMPDGPEAPARQQEECVIYLETFISVFFGQFV